MFLFSAKARQVKQLEIFEREIKSAKSEMETIKNQCRLVRTQTMDIYKSLF